MVTIFYLFAIAISFYSPFILCFAPKYMNSLQSLYHHAGRSVFPVLPSSNNHNTDDTTTNDLLKAAAKLRKEAEELEQSMKSRNILSTGKTKQRTDVNAAVEQANQKEDALPTTAKKYTSLKDSTWAISYRFASDAINQDKNDKTDKSFKPTFYSGKVKVTFRGDGYTTMETSDDDNNDIMNAASSNVLKFQKIWGWDEETSRDDGMQYILFSADVLLPESDPNYSKVATRFYFQCRVDRDSKTEEISMSDGTVTIKKDIEPPGGFWGVFNAGGILAQFRFCGNFLMKPMSK